MAILKMIGLTYETNLMETIFLPKTSLKELRNSLCG